ncbi:HAD family phosphatase [Herbiconiux sp. L3-i23]|uniref:HAD family hydrolase n=1 Tax=Herbiconiux sp. L3-i23 TaxID=2905871 RepID=UPI002072EA13|nr:beta-phosphoglucomutase family hydrolase [Herbiconiux sp. L3-i23]
MTRDLAALSLAECEAVLFDLDGVVTPTAEVHMKAWAQVFEEEFAKHGVTVPYSDADYFASLDGKPRYDGVQSLLSSRGIDLPWGSADDPGDAETVCGIGNRKNAVFAAILEHEGVAPYAGSLDLIVQLAARGIPMAVVSSSKNARPVLRAAGLGDRFDAVVDGVTAVEEGIPGKPAPDMFLAGAKRLGFGPATVAVFEDAISGVAAAHAGEFGLVVGVDRGVGPEPLLAAGADLVVQDLEELVARDTSDSDVSDNDMSGSDISDSTDQEEVR